MLETWKYLKSPPKNFQNVMMSDLKMLDLNSCL